MVALKQFGPYTGTNKPTVGNIILACHSGSGDVMRTIAAGSDIAATKIQECWAFEPSASIGSANQWKTWVQSRPTDKLYIYYLPGTAGKSLCQGLGGRLTASGQVTCAPRIFAEQAVVAHDAVPARYFKDRIQGAGFLSTNLFVR